MPFIYIYISTQSENDTIYTIYIMPKWCHGISTHIYIHKIYSSWLIVSTLFGHHSTNNKQKRRRRGDLDRSIDIQYLLCALFDPLSCYQCRKREKKREEKVEWVSKRNLHTQQHRLLIRIQIDKIRSTTTTTTMTSKTKKKERERERAHNGNRENK